MPWTEPPKDVDAVRQRLSGLGNLPKRMRQCADHLGTNLDQIALSTVAELAAGAGVSPSALMRFCQIIGFSGFSDMQRLFRGAMVPEMPDYATRLRKLTSERAGSPAALIAEFADSGRKSLEVMSKNLDDAGLAQAVQILSSARILHLMGMGRAYPVAAYLAYVCEKLTIAAVLHDGTGGRVDGQTLRPDDALLVISFAPYSRETLGLAAAAKGRGVPVVALTDNLSGGGARLADCVLTVKEVDFGAFRALSASLAMAIGLMVAVAAARGGQTDPAAVIME